MGTAAPRLVADLVERFERDRKVCLCVPCPRSRRAARRQVFPSPDYKEEQLRAHCLTVRRSAFDARTFLVPVIHEESINACPERSRRVAGATRAPDYTFRIGGRRTSAVRLPAASSGLLTRVQTLLC
jgi:hypothetical protein